jgi:hypothetical protein
MSRLKTVLIVIFALVFVGGLGAVAILTAQRQNTTKPVAPTVPQVTPHATELTGCTVNFTVSPVNPQLRCTGVTMSPNNSTITAGTDTRSLTAAATGGTAPITFTWLVTSDGTNKGNLSSTTGSTVTWSPPISLADSQTWSITATAKDATGQTDASGCSVTLSYTKPATPTHKECQNNACVTVSGAGTDNCPNNCQPTTYQHKVCLGNSCSSVQCSPATSPCADTCSTNADCGTTTTTVTPTPPAPSTHRECRNNACVSISGAGTDTCTSDVSCQPVAVAPPIPKSGSTEITIGSIILGAGAIIVGLLLAL